MPIIAPVVGAIAGRVAAPIASRLGAKAALGAATRMGGGRVGQFLQGKAFNAALDMETAAASGGAARAGMLQGYAMGHSMPSSTRQNFDDGLNTGGMY